MPMPKSHLAQSRKLSAAIAASAAVSAGQLESLSELCRDPKLLAVIDELHDNDKERRKAARNATSYLRGRGVKIPKGMIVRLIDNNWYMSFCVHWTSKTGVDVSWGFHYDSETGWGWGC